MSVLHPFPQDIALLHNFSGTLQPDIGEPMAVQNVSLTQGPGAIHGISLQGYVSWVAGEDRNNMYSATPSTAYDLSQTDFTIEGWMRLTVAPTNYQALLVTLVPGFSFFEFGLMVGAGGAGGRLLMYIRTGPSPAQSFMQNSTGVINLNQAHHMAMTRDGDLYRLYLDGQLVQSYSHPWRFDPGPREINIASGVGSGGVGVHGFVDSICITRRSLYDGSFTPPPGPYALAMPAPTIVGCHVWPAGAPQ